jgi:SNF2 family DNA or RNA helicase
MVLFHLGFSSLTVVLRSSGSDEFCDGCNDLKLQGLTTAKMSTKMSQILAILNSVKKDSQGTEKTIIFSEFVSMLDIIADCLKENGIGFVRCASFSIYANHRHKIFLV